MDIPLELSDTQYKFMSSQSRFVAMIGGVGSGKTFTGCLKAVMEAIEHPGSHGAIVASTYRALNDFVVPMLTEQLWSAMGQPEAWGELVESFNKTTMMIKFRNGSYIYLRSCDRPDELRGQNLSWFFIDEAAKVPHKVWKLMVARLRVPPEKGWITTTPRGRNWVWEEWARKPRKDYEFFIGSTDENKHLSTDYIESLRESYSGNFLAQEFHGQFVGWQGLVYDINLEAHHLEAPEPLSDEYKYAIGGVDWGWIDPSVILVGLVGFDDSLHIVDEWYEKKAPIEKICKIAVEFNEKWNIRTFFCDSARPEYIQEFRNFNLDARKGKKELDPGIAIVNASLDKGLLYIDFNNCPELINEAETYHYEEDDMGVILKDRPIDKDNHALDALRYMVYSHSKRGYVGSQRGYR